MSNSPENILVGSTGWQHANWQNSFYPEDMPKDWQLDFYSNQFQTILITSNEWLEWSSGAIEEMRETLDKEDFYFVFKVDALNTAEQTQLRLLKRILGELFYAVLLVNEAASVLDKNLSNFIGFLDVKVTYQTLQKMTGNEWNYVFNGQFYSGFPMLEVSLSDLSLDQKKQLLNDFSSSLEKSVEGGLIFISPSTQLSVQALVDFQILSELLGC